MTIDFFTSINVQRVDNLIDNFELRHRQKPMIENILSFVVHMYCAIYKDSNLFCASLLIPDPEKEELKAWITKRSSNNGFHLKSQKTDVDKAKVFGLGGRSIASKSWRCSRALSANVGIEYLYEDQESYLKSIIAYPIECSDHFHIKVNESDYKIDKIIGVLCVSSSNESVFTRKRCATNMTMLKPFISMLNYHYSFRVIDKIQKGN